jgi:hypothetical protein
VYVDTEMETWGIGLHPASLRIQRDFWGNKYRKSAPRISATFPEATGRLNQDGSLHGRDIANRQSILS